MPRQLSPARIPVLLLSAVAFAMAAIPRIEAAEAPVVPPKSGPNEIIKPFDGWKGAFDCRSGICAELPGSLMWAPPCPSGSRAHEVLQARAPT